MPAFLRKAFQELIETGEIDPETSALTAKQLLGDDLGLPKGWSYAQGVREVKTWTMVENRVGDDDQSQG